MASEMRRVAKALVESRSEAFATRYSRDESMRRVASALAKRMPRLATVETAWKDEAEGLRLDVSFRPARVVGRLLGATSITLVLMIAASAWTLFSAEEPTALKFLVPLVTALGVLGFPILVVALGSQREAEEARLIRAIRHALLDEDEFPKPIRDRE
jgi:hypothetical protein